MNASRKNKIGWAILWMGLLSDGTPLGASEVDAEIEPFVRLRLKTVQGQRYQLLKSDAGRVNQWGEFGEAFEGTSDIHERIEPVGPGSEFFRFEAETLQREAFVIPDLELRMNPVLAGSFTYGTPEGEHDRGDTDGTLQRLTIRYGFWMAETETTEGQYAGLDGFVPPQSHGDSYPVYGMGFEAAHEFCRQLTERHREAGRLPEGFVYRLPLEAEWEYVCRAQTTTRFSYGDDRLYRELDDYAWYQSRANPPEHPEPVGLKLPNPWGFFDLYGNVREYTLNAPSAGYPPNLNQVAPLEGPVKESFEQEVVLRGGSWLAPARELRSGSRISKFLPWYPTRDDAGFRIVLAPVPEALVAERFETEVVDASESGALTDDRLSVERIVRVQFPTVARERYQIFSSAVGNELSWSPSGEPIRGNGKVYTEFRTPLGGENYLRVERLPYESLGELGIEMVAIPAGSFQMGTPANETGRNRTDLDLRSVEIAEPFWMAATEINQRQFETVTGISPVWKHAPSEPVSTSFINVMAFCAALTERERISGRLPEGYVYRLPFEAEWEYACRAGTTSRFFSGDSLSSLEPHAWYIFGDLFNLPVDEYRLHVSGETEPNPWGLFDMHGNVAELCLNHWDYPEFPPLDSAGYAPFEGPLAPGFMAAARGGDYDSVSADIRSGSRKSVRPSDDFGPGRTGFRIVLARSPERLLER